MSPSSSFQFAAQMPAEYPGLEAFRSVIDARLSALAPVEGAEPLSEAVRYALLSPGKRTRPIMAMLCARHFGGDAGDVLDAACAFEMVHAASLVFDDLPCMDDAALRRGRQTVHRRFGEDAAVLAGVALLNEAFGVLARDTGLPDGLARRLIGRLSTAIGLSGLVSGQMSDLRERGDVTVDRLLRLNDQKTGVLFCAAAEAGALVGGASDLQAATVRTFARHVGAAFQIRDDLLDGASPEITGKDGNQDAGKPTFVSLLGVGGARRRLEAERDAARAALATLGDPGELGTFSEGLLTLDGLVGGERGASGSLVSV